MDQETKVIVEQVAKSAAKEAVREFAVKFGIDVDNPIEFQKDTAHLRAWRKLVEKVEQKALLSVVALIVVAIGSAVWIGIKTKIGM